MELSRTVKWMELLASEDFWVPDFEQTQTFTRHSELSSCDRPHSALCEMTKTVIKSEVSHLGHTSIIQKVTEERQEQRGGLAPGGGRAWSGFSEVRGDVGTRR